VLSSVAAASETTPRCAHGIRRVRSFMESTLIIDNVAFNVARLELLARVLALRA
jgi:hypothetical protein